MERNELEQAIAAAVYGEISEDERKQLDEWLDAHPNDRAEFDELVKTRALMDRASEVATAETRIHASQIVSMNQPKTARRRRWAMAAAACLALLFCVSQGMVIQVGTIRVALGPAADSQALRREIDRELAANYLPAVNELIGTVDRVHSNWKMLANRQNSIEDSMQILAVMRGEDRQFQERSIKQLVSIMNRNLDQRLGQIIYASMPPVLSNESNTNSGIRINNTNINPLEEFNHER